MQLRETDLEKRRLGHSVQELQNQLNHVTSKEKDLQSKIHEAQDQVSLLTGTKTDLLRQTCDTAGELSGTKHKLEDANARLETLANEKNLAVANLERELAAERQRVVDLTAKLH